MNRYITYCTQEQTRKALNLGAPIKRALFPSTWFEEMNPKRCHIDITENPNGCTLAIPTTEQMINWLEEQECIRCVEITETFEWHYRVKKKHDDVDDWIQGSCQTRKEATLAAIDAALEYLSNEK